MVIGPVVAGSSKDATAVVQPLLAELAGVAVRLDTGESEGDLSQFLAREGDWLPTVRSSLTRCDEDALTAAGNSPKAMPEVRS
jgi:hypothetical protein